MKVNVQVSSSIRQVVCNHLS